MTNSTTDWFDSPTLSGDYVTLEPLALAHAEGLHEAGKDPAIWTWLSARQPVTVADTRESVEAGLIAARDHVRLPWVQLDADTGEVAGTTSFYEIDPHHRALYIGYTWLGARWQRTALNTEAKLLLLTRAFDTLGAHRVGWHTDINNTRSQRAIERLGATREGVLRSHRIRPDGTLRDTVVYSVTDAEWPAVRDRLRERLATHQAR
ncbi:GNAT family N-acetyltransferase [Nocardia jejuensis]|uniref:GNAT family N-acetyltransferase n=1 Tax=Nocardia jejuensis TaxID=328049 RepID=UPI00083791FF|nr:GNAT family protein [Nocardia jejuensis]